MLCVEGIQNKKAVSNTFIVTENKLLLLLLLLIIIEKELEIDKE